MNGSINDILVVSDLDGTLVPKGGIIPGCNADLIRLFMMMGGSFTIATGRNIESARRYYRQLKLTLPAIVYNGAVIYDYSTEKALVEHFLPKSEILSAIGIIRQTLPEAGVALMADNGRAYVVVATDAIYKHLNYEGYSFLLADEQLLPENWYKALVVCPNTRAQKELHDTLKKKRIDGIDIVFSNEENVELLPKGVTKATALKQLTKLLGKKMANTVMMGDYDNDIEALKAAGVAVVPADAPKHIRAHADRVVMPSYEGGVAEYLYDIIRQSKG